MTIAITNEFEYKTALKRLSDIMYAELGTPEGDEVESLIDQLIAYEKPFEPALPDPIGMIKCALENKNWSINDL